MVTLCVMLRDGRIVVVLLFGTNDNVIRLGSLELKGSTSSSINMSIFWPLSNSLPILILPFDSGLMVS